MICEIVAVLGGIVYDVPYSVSQFCYSHIDITELKEAIWNPPHSHLSFRRQHNAFVIIEVK